MRVDCPSCAANYEIPDHLLVKGRKARCARCGVRFVPLAAEPEAIDADRADERTEAVGDGATAGNVPSTNEAIATEPAVPDRLAVQSHDPRPPLALKAAWAASIILLLACGAGTVIWRDTVVRHWPAGALILGGPGPMAPGQ